MNKIAKIIITAVLAIGAVLALVAMLNAIGLMSSKGFDTLDTLAGQGASSATKASMWTYFAMFLAFFGCTVALILCLLGKGKKIVPLVFIVVGVLATIFMCVAIGANADHMDALKKAAEAAEALKDTPMEAAYKAAALSHSKEIFVAIINIIVFGCIPAGFGAKLLLENR